MRQSGGDMPQLQSTIANFSNQYQYEDAGTAFASEAAMHSADSMMLQTADVVTRTMGGTGPMGGGSTGHFSIQPTGKFAMAIRALRVVQQYLTDRNDNIPLEKRVLYKGNEFLTDLSDDELRYNVPVMDLLRAHNEYRVTVRDKAYKDKEVFLEEARPGELCLTTVTLAAI